MLKQLFAIPFATLAALAGGKAADAAAYAFVDVQIVDVVRGELTPPRTVVIDGSRIVSIANDAAEVPPGVRRIDATGRYLMPGLVDMHVHLFNTSSGRAPNDWAFPMFIANGVTGVREMAANAASMPTVRRWRAAIERGELIAPRVLAVGMPVGPRSSGSIPEQVAAAKAAGADFVKVFSGVPAASFDEIAAAAGDQAIEISGHTPSTVRAVDGAKAGLRTNEHFVQWFEACTSIESKLLAKAALPNASNEPDANRISDMLAKYDDAACRSTANSVAATRQVQVPTLVLMRPSATAADRPAAYRTDPRWLLLRPDEQERWSRIIDRDPTLKREWFDADWQFAQHIMRALRDADVRVLAGTDAPMPLVYPGYSLHDELEWLVAAGMTNADALRSATSWPAEHLRIANDTGSIDAGMRADLVLLTANPLERIGNTRKIAAVVFGGRLLERDELDALVTPKPPSAETIVETHK